MILKRDQHVKYLPFTFTEHGILMLSSVLNSDRAEKVNILIIDTFVRLREILFVHKDMEHQLEKVQTRFAFRVSRFLKFNQGFIYRIPQIRCNFCLFGVFMPVRDYFVNIGNDRWSFLYVHLFCN